MIVLSLIIALNIFIVLVVWGLMIEKELVEAELDYQRAFRAFSADSQNNQLRHEFLNAGRHLAGLANRRRNRGNKDVFDEVVLERDLLACLARKSSFVVRSLPADRAA